MDTSQAPTLVLGEAPESDEDSDAEADTKQDTTTKSSIKLTSVVLGTAISGEAIESDEEIELHNTETSTANRAHIAKNVKHDREVPPKHENIKSNCVKKLYERNKSLYENMTSFKQTILNSTNTELGYINQALLKSQLEMQQTLTNIRSVKTNLMEICGKMNNIIAAGYIPSINIKVPAHII